MWDFFGRVTTRAEDAQGTPIQSHISTSILVYEENRFNGEPNFNEVELGDARAAAPICALNPTPCIPHPNHHIPKPYTLHTEPHTLHANSHALNLKPHTLNHKPHNLNPRPHTLHA